MGDLINELPDECLECIFSFLSVLERLKVEKVCKRWYQIGKNGWPDVEDLVINEDHSNNTVYSILKRCGRFLKKLKICLSPFHCDCLSMIIQTCKLDQLKCISILIEWELEEIELEIRNLIEIFENARNLVDITICVDLEIYGTNFFEVMNDETLQRLEVQHYNYNYNKTQFNPRRFPNLKELKLKNFNINKDTIRRMIESFTGLEKLHLRSCYILTDFIEGIQIFVQLRELTLKNIDSDMTNEDIRQISRHCEKMKAMTLNQVDIVTSECFKYLGEMLSLEVLSLEDFDVEHRDILYLMNVKDLNLHSCEGIIENDGLIQLIVKSPNLEKLGLYSIYDLNKIFIDNVLQIFHRGLRQKNLSLIVRQLIIRDELLEVTRNPINNHSLLKLDIRPYY